jgi:hypothetical protein
VNQQDVVVKFQDNSFCDAGACELTAARSSDCDVTLGMDANKRKLVEQVGTQQAISDRGGQN